MTQRAKLAPPTNPAERGDHPNAVRLVKQDGTLTDEGLRLGVMVGDPQLPSYDKRMEALKDQALRQEVYGIRPSKN